MHDENIHSILVRSTHTFRQKLSKIKKRVYLTLFKVIQVNIIFFFGFNSFRTIRFTLLLAHVESTVCLKFLFQNF
jgi:hypothetical protein